MRGHRELAHGKALDRICSVEGENLAYAEPFTLNEHFAVRTCGTIALVSPLASERFPRAEPGVRTAIFEAIKPENLKPAFLIARTELEALLEKGCSVCHDTAPTPRCRVCEGTGSTQKGADCKRCAGKGKRHCASCPPMLLASIPGLGFACYFDARLLRRLLAGFPPGAATIGIGPTPDNAGPRSLTEPLVLTAPDAPGWVGLIMGWLDRPVHERRGRGKSATPPPTDLPRIVTLQVFP